MRVHKQNPHDIPHGLKVLVENRGAQVVFTILVGLTVILVTGGKLFTNERGTLTPRITGADLAGAWTGTVRDGKPITYVIATDGTVKIITQESYGPMIVTGTYEARGGTIMLHQLDQRALGLCANPERNPVINIPFDLRGDKLKLYYTNDLISSLGQENTDLIRKTGSITLPELPTTPPADWHVAGRPGEQYIEGPKQRPSYAKGPATGTTTTSNDERTSQATSPIVGTWTGQVSTDNGSATVIYSFDPGGTFMLTRQNAGDPPSNGDPGQSSDQTQTVRGTYEVAGNTIRLNAQVFTFQIGGEDLSINDPATNTTLLLHHR